MNTAKYLFLTLSFVLMSFQLTACGNKAQDKQKKVDVANSDLDRMGVVEIELQAHGVYLSNSAKTEMNIDQMPKQKLDQVELLLQEFLARGQNVVVTARSEGISYPEEKTQMIEIWMKSARRIHKLVLVRKENFQENSEMPRETFHGKFPEKEFQYSKGENCPQTDGILSPHSIPQGAATRYVGRLGSKITNSVDWLEVKFKRVKGSCDLFVFSFPRKTKNSTPSKCKIHVVTRYDQVIEEKSDSTFSCKK